MRKTVRFALASLLLATLLPLTGCATMRVGSVALRSAPAGGTAPAPPARPSAGKPVYLLKVGAATTRPPAPPAPPFSVADETAGRWLVLFEISYPALATGTGAP